MPYSIKLYNEKEHLDDLLSFTSHAQTQGIENNASLEAIALKPESGMFLTYHEDEVVAMTYTHDFSKYYSGAWRICCRTATRKDWQARDILRRPGMVASAGISAYTIPYQVDYARERGAKIFLFTTNILGEGGTDSSAKLGRHLALMQHRDPVYRYYDTANIYDMRQDVWKLEYRDIINVQGKLHSF